MNKDFMLSGIELLIKAKECMVKADIYQHSFISFGTSLGAVRPTLRKPDHKIPYYAKGFIQHDHDMDIGFLADKFSLEQREAYYRYCAEAKLLHWGNPPDRIVRRPDTNEIVWFSIKHRDKGMRSCNWMFFEWKGWYWHTKGKKWAGDTKGKTKFDHAKFPRQRGEKGIMLGAPAKYFTPLQEIEFEGIRVHVPLQLGSLLDWWYGGWFKPKKGGASKKKVVAFIYDWKDRKKWVVR